MATTKRKGVALHHWILLAMILGAAIGIPLNLAAEAGTLDPSIAADVARFGNELGRLFLRLLQMVVVPLIFASLVSGVTGLGHPARLGRLGAITFTYYMATSLVAIVLGIVLVNAIGPGRGVDTASLGVLRAGAAPPAIADESRSVWQVLWEQITGMIPSNPVASAAEGDMLAIIFFALMLGLFISLTGGEHGRTMSNVFYALFAVMMKMTTFVIALAPFGVLGFMLHASAGAGLEAFAALGLYMLTVAIGLVVHACVTLPSILFVVSRRSPWALAQAVGPALLTAFSTASSNATLPLTLTCIEERAGVPNRIGSFVLPLGATVNMDGTALYEVVAVLFIAQVYGVDLDIGQQVVVAFTALLASVGAAGIPHAGTVMMVVVLSAVGLPTDAVGLILAVDRVLDMARTTVNVWSDCTAAAVIHRFDPDPPQIHDAPPPTKNG